jgi:hypothetical protein
LTKLSMRRAVALAASAVLASTLLVGAPLSASASTPGIFAPGFEEANRAFLTTFGVTGSAQDELIDVLASGGTWDSMSTAHNKPIKSRQHYADGVTWDVSEFADGSISAKYVGSGVPGSSQLEMSPMGVNDCGYSSGKTGNFSNCNIYMWVGAVSMGFKANFTINASGYDKITLLWGASWAIGGACSASQLYFGTPKATESSTGPAIGLLTVQAQMCVVGYNSNFNSELAVGSNKATHSWW